MHGNTVKITNIEFIDYVTLKISKYISHHNNINIIKCDEKPNPNNIFYG